jgi:parvulin-like peptidyl-prolyl isomerase
MAPKDKKKQVKNNESSSSEIVRKFKQSPGIYIGSIVILILITVTFVGGDFLSGKFGGSGGDMTFGYYDKAPVTLIPGNTFAQYYNQVLQYYQAQGADMSNYFTVAQVWRQAYEMAVTHTAILQMLKRSNYSVPEKTVDRQVAQLPQFQENGRFSAALYNQMTDSSRLVLWRQVQEELAKNNYYSDFLYGLMIPSGEADFIGRMNSNMRSFEMVSYSLDNYPEFEYQSYAQEKAALFRTIHLSMISVNSSEREAKKILDSIKNGVVTFEDAARTQSQDSYASRGGDTGIRYYYEIESEIPNVTDRETIINLRKGELSDCFRIGDSWVIFRVEDEIKPADFDDYSVMDRVKSYLRSFDRGRMEDWTVAQTREFIRDAQDSGFDNAAMQWSLNKYSFGPLPLNYAGVELFTALESFLDSGISQQDLQSLSRNENFWKIAFSTKLNTPSEPLVQGDNVLVFFPVEEINIDETARENIISEYTSYWVYMLAEQSLQSYFVNDPRLDDRFWDTFFKYFMP